MKKLVVKHNIENINDTIVLNLKEIANEKRRNGDTWRVRAYTQAIAAIKIHDKPITSKEDALKIHGIGKSIAEKIQEIIDTGKLKDIKTDDAKQKQVVVDMFLKVWGAGPVAANRWYEQGYRTLEDLLDNPKLTHQQEVGIKHYYDIQKRIPREEINQMKVVLEQATNNINVDWKIQICGSYRRNLPNSGDIDCLITNTKTDDTKGMINSLVTELYRNHFLTDDLSKGPEKYMGVCKIGTVFRRIDIRSIPRKEWIPALLYFTGSATLNKQMRQKAIDMGYKLNEMGLFKVDSGDNLHIETEQDIFKELEMDYLTPEQRSIK